VFCTRLCKKKDCHPSTPSLPVRQHRNQSKSRSAQVFPPPGSSLVRAYGIPRGEPALRAARAHGLEREKQQYSASARAGGEVGTRRHGLRRRTRVNLRALSSRHRCPARRGISRGQDNKANISSSPSPKPRRRDRAHRATATASIRFRSPAPPMVNRKASLGFTPPCGVSPADAAWNKPRWITSAVYRPSHA
jgi:hypothetical protein